MKFSLKTTFLYRLGLLLTLTTAASSCSKDEFLDVNDNPNLPQSVTPNVLLTGIEATTGFAVGNELGRVTSLLIQHQAGIANQPATYDTYALRGAFDNSWNFELYGGALINTRLLIDQNQATNPVYAGLGKLMRAYNFALATDLWGDVPYSQANLGPANLQPRFDAQQDIYQGNTALGIESLFDLVRSGMKDLDNTSNLLLPGTADDIVYKGDLVKWRRFGNTLLLKLANTISRKNPDLARTVINEVLAKGPTAIITSNTDDFEVPFGTSVGNQNPLYSYNFVNRPDDQMMSRRFLDSLRIVRIRPASGTPPRPDTVFRNDPRLPRFFTTTPRTTAASKTPFGFFTGYDNAGTQAVPLRVNRSRYAPYVVGVSGEAPVRLVTNFQRAFILAESALTLGTAGDAQALFQEGIRASMTKAGVSATDITAYFVANPSLVTLSPAAADRDKNLNKILTQKWIAWVGNGYEAFNDFRRTGYPRLQIVLFPSSDSPSSIPVRLFYPNSEISTNTSQVPTPQPNVTARVWWDID
ncbi:SusD/RagB family nutrient-binding outer membrane lipoprotein [Hymenobacter algoricola]|uniref:SusD/RagB family nutrient-binding outer membrane lipoprotein n=1 Tax=Hymenobacter algoricola TaxID=486267 RepID=A0ABP7MQL2_9BACT